MTWSPTRLVPASSAHSRTRPGQLAGKGAPKHAPRMPFALLVTGLIVGGFALLLLLNTASAANEVRRHDITARDAGVAARVQELRNEDAASAAPGNLAQAAAALGMVPAINPAFLVVSTGGAVRVLGSPAPASSIAQPPQHTTSPTSTASKTAKSTATKSTGRHQDSTTTTAAHSTSSATPTSTPTPTPTPTLTLPGGNR